MKQLIICIVFSMTLLVSGLAQASPLRLEYRVTAIDGGLYDYEFTLIVDNNDGSFTQGNTWGWITFGDTADGRGTSPLADFTPDENDYPIGQYTGMSTGEDSIHLNQAPYLEPLLPSWRPSLGDSLSWSGTSSNFVGPGELLLTTYTSANGAVAASAQVAQVVPEPGTVLLLGMGLMGLARKSRRQI